MRKVINIGYKLGLLFFFFFSKELLAGNKNIFIRTIEEKGIGWAYIIAYIYGVLTSLTPCVYPMIAITVALFGAKKASKRSEALLLSSFFVLGIAFMYTTLGVVSALGGKVFGSFLANKYLIGAIAFIFFLIALSMFGFFEFSLPYSIQSRLNQVGGSGYLGSFLMGLVSGIIAAPCTGPITLGIMLWISTTRSIFLGASFFFIFALGLGTLFFIVGVFSISLPKGGRWLEGVKTFMGITMIGVSIYFINIIYPVYRLFTFSKGLFFVLGSIFFIISIILGVFHLSLHSFERRDKVRKILGLIFVNLGVFLLLGGILHKGDKVDLKWETDIDKAIERAKKEGRPILVDFSARWCNSCMELERETFSSPEVIEELRRFILVKIDSTEMTEKVEEIHRKFNIKGLPTILILDPTGKELKRISQFIPPESMVKYLRKVK